MKPGFLLAGLLCQLLSFTVSTAQSRENQLGFAAGGGPQDYASQLGNGFKLSGENSWHGAALLHAGSYINRSLDLVFGGAIGDLGTSRLHAVSMSLKYKFADGRMLPEESLLKPYICAGAAFNNLSLRSSGYSSYAGNYISLNGALGVRCYITARVNIGYNLAAGYFILEHENPDAQSRPNEVFLHNALMLGIDVL